MLFSISFIQELPGINGASHMRGLKWVQNIRRDCILLRKLFRNLASQIWRKHWTTCASKKNERLKLQLTHERQKIAIDFIDEIHKGLMLASPLHLPS